MKEISILKRIFKNQPEDLEHFERVLTSELGNMEIEEANEFHLEAVAKFSKFLKWPVDDERIIGNLQSEILYDFQVPKHQRNDLPYETYQDFHGKPLSANFWAFIWGIRI